MPAAKAQRGEWPEQPAPLLTNNLLWRAGVYQTGRRISDMNSLINSTMGPSGPAMMSTIEIADVTGKEHRNVLRDTRGTLTSLYMPEGSTFDDLIDHGSKLSHEGFQVVMDHRGYIKEILLDREHTMTLVTGYDVKLRKRVVDKLAEHERQQVRPLTTAEMFVQNAALMLQIEQKQAAHDKAIHALEYKMEQVEKTQAVLATCPPNAEPITKIRERMNKKYKLSAQIVDSVMRQTSYAPKPAALVKNPYGDGKETTYLVYWKKDVTEVFDRFVAECKAITASFYTHPFIEGRFKVEQGSVH